MTDLTHSSPAQALTTTPSNAAPSDPTPGNPAGTRIVTATTIAAALGMILLVVPEIWVAAAAFVWAVAGLAHLAAPATIVMAALVAVPTLWASWTVARMAFEAETDPAIAGEAS